MHYQGIIHGDLKGVRFRTLSYYPIDCSPLPQANILIDGEGHARIADFGIVAIASDQPTHTSSPVWGGTTRWMSPELLNPEPFGLKESHPTKESDCYALGMVVYEVLSGRRPFTSSKDHKFILMVLDGKRPERPEGKEGRLFTDAIWKMLELCWKHQPSDRPSAKTVLLCLEGTPPPPPWPPSDGGGVVETDADDHRSDTTSDSSMLSPASPEVSSSL